MLHLLSFNFKNNTIIIFHKISRISNGNFMIDSENYECSSFTNFYTSNRKFQLLCMFFKIVIIRLVNQHTLSDLAEICENLIA